jgi:hypothetical protein
MLAEIVTRLKSQVPSLVMVGRAADFQVAAESNPPATPAAYILSLSEEATPSALASDVAQRVALVIGVVLVVRNVADAQGLAAQADMDVLRAAVKAVLLGWPPIDDADPLERASSHLLAFRDGHMWWQDSYITAFFDRSLI